MTDQAEMQVLSDRQFIQELADAAELVLDQTEQMLLGLNEGDAEDRLRRVIQAARKRVMK